MLAQLVRLDPSLGCSMEEDERLLMSLGDTDGAFDAHACSDEKLEPIGVVRGQQYQQRKLPCRAPSKAASQPQAQRQNTRRKFKARRQPKGVVHSILAPPQSDDTKRSMEPLLLVNMTGHGQQAPDHLSSKQNLQPLPPPLPNPYVRPSVFIPRPSDIRQQTVKRSPLPAPRMKSVQQHRLQLHRLMDIIKRHENNYNLAPVTTVDVQVSERSVVRPADGMFRPLDIFVLHGIFNQIALFIQLRHSHPHITSPTSFTSSSFSPFAQTYRLVSLCILILSLSLTFLFVCF
eukprot:m.286657 g.286657  ORF g.286657 m.286657 type:complete len:289 (+) comp15781_c1_seq1:195-1061(+)